MGATHTKYSFDAEYIFAQHSSQISCADPEGGHTSQKKYRASGPDPLKNHKATKPAFKVWPVKHHLNGGRADYCLLIVVFGGRKVVKVGPPLTKLSGSAYESSSCYFWPTG